MGPTTEWGAERMAMRRECADERSTGTEYQKCEKKEEDVHPRPCPPRSIFFKANSVEEVKEA